jgi:hypothetical protein
VQKSSQPLLYYLNPAPNVTAGKTSFLLKAPTSHHAFQDLAAIKAGAYKLPWDMTTPTHRQFNPLYVASK